MATTNPSQLFLLADHIKLSLLERKRAQQLKLPTTTDSQISRSLDQLSAGIESLDRQLSTSDQSSRPSPERDQLLQLRRQYDDLRRDYTGDGDVSGTVTSPNDPALKGDFEAAMDDGRRGRVSKAVRFTDDPSSPSKANRDALFPYRDNPDDEEDVAPDHAHLDNQQIHAYHQNVMAQQDEQLDQLGMSIGRQRDLSIAIGNELDEQVEILDAVDEGVDRHQGQLDGAMKRVNKIAKRAKENWSMTTIIVLIIILVLLIVITK